MVSRRRLPWGGLLSALLFGCAQVEAPSGGPADQEAPRVLATRPDSGAVRVPPTDTLTLLFSEPVDRKSVEEAFFLSPPVVVRDRRWERQTWILLLETPLRPGITYAGLLGTTAKDRHGIALAAPWSFAFSTGDSLDDGVVEGKVVGQRFPGKGAFLFAWGWDAAPPDTTAEEGVPADPIRLGQADAQGAFRLDFLPRERPLRICALYDRDGDRRFDPGADRWACAEDPVIVADTARVAGGLELFLADADEPGTVAGTLVDSLCLRRNPARALADARAERDSLRAWLSGEGDGEGAERSEGEAAVPPPLSTEDSLRVGRELNRLDALETEALADSAWCARPVVAQLVAGDTTVVREARGATFSWADVPPAIYELRAFRDVNANGRPDEGEPLTQFPHRVEVRPLRVLKDLELLLPEEGGPADRGPAEGSMEGGGRIDGRPADGVPQEWVPQSGDRQDGGPADAGPVDAGR